MIEVSNLTKEFRLKREGRSSFSNIAFPKYSRFIAVDDVSFNIKKGEVVGLLGPNGAGKSTIIKILASLLLPTSGSALIDGHPPGKQREHIGLALGFTMLYHRISGYDNLEYYGKLYGVKNIRDRIHALTRQVGLDGKLSEYVEHYSTGMKAKLAIARALIADPDVLILDEPTLGLDIKIARELRHFILSLNKTILITTHYIEEARELSDRIIILKNGRISKIINDPQHENIEESLISEY